VGPGIPSGGDFIDRDGLNELKLPASLKKKFCGEPKGRRDFSDVSQLNLSDCTAGTHQCVPPGGYQFIDSLICAIPTGNKKTSMLAQQTTKQPVVRHKGTRNFFKDAYKKWEVVLGREPDWYLLWVVTAKEKKKNQHLHNKLVSDQNGNFTELFFSFQDFHPTLLL
jgi:hypothetical protein